MEVDMKRQVFKIIAGLSLLLAGLWVVADVSIPHVFAPNTTISSDEVNENFEALNNEINLKQQRVGESCEEGSAIRMVNDDGTVECEPDDVGSGGSYSAGTGLGLSGTEFSVDPAYQLPQGCSAGQQAFENSGSWRCGDAGLSAVESNSTLLGDGTSSNALGVAANAIDSVRVKDASLESKDFLDEPGYNQSPFDGNSYNVSSVTPVSFASVTIDAPASGYVLVMAKANMALEHTNGKVQNALVGVSSSATTQTARVVVRLSNNLPTGDYWIPVATQNVFAASQGSNTFYLTASDNFGGGTTDGIQINSPLITAVYLPTRYD